MSRSEDDVIELESPTPSGYLALNPVLAWLPGEPPERQAARVFNWIMTFIENTDKPVALVYSANESQSQRIDAAQNLDEPLRVDFFNGHGQARFFAELVKLINQESKDIRKIIKDRTDAGQGISTLVALGEKLKNIHIIPIPTSLRGGTDTSSNAVSQKILDDRITYLEDHINEGYAVFAIPNANRATRRFAIGGGVSVNFDKVPFLEDGTTRGAYVENRLSYIQQQTANNAADALYETNEARHMAYDIPKLAQQLRSYRTKSDRNGWDALKNELINDILLSPKEHQAELVRSFGPLLDMHYNFPGLRFMRGETNARQHANFILASSGYCLPPARPEPATFEI